TIFWTLMDNSGRKWSNNSQLRSLIAPKPVFLRRRQASCLPLSWDATSSVVGRRSSACTARKTPLPANDEYRMAIISCSNCQRSPSPLPPPARYPPVGRRVEYIRLGILCQVHRQDLECVRLVAPVGPPPGVKHAGRTGSHCWMEMASSPF